MKHYGGACSNIVAARIAGLFALLALAAPLGISRVPADAVVSGRVTFTGTATKSRPLDLSKEPDCVRLNPGGIASEDAVTGSANGLKNVVVYISSGDTEPTSAVPPAGYFNQQGCHYATHVLAVQVGQAIQIANSDPISHNIHPLAKVNREWNRIQPPNTPAFTYSYESEEFIPVKCNIHPWMKAYFAVLKTSHFEVTPEDGSFKLSGLKPGKYTITAWHESFGTKNQEITVGGGDTQTVNFVFTAH